MFIISIFPVLIWPQVPLHLIQGRFRNPLSESAASGNTAVQQLHANPPPWDPVSEQVISCQVHLIQEFLRDRLVKNGQTVVLEDEHLPIKKRAPKPRLPPTGKISTPRKRKEGANSVPSSAKKRRKLNSKEIPANKEFPAQVQLPTPPMAQTQGTEEDKMSDIESLFG
jgi:transcriptional activator SPT7